MPTNAQREGLHKQLHQQLLNAEYVLVLFSCLQRGCNSYLQLLKLDVNSWGFVHIHFKWDIGTYLLSLFESAHPLVIGSVRSTLVNSFRSLVT